MFSHEYKSAKATFRLLPTGVGEVSYYGFMDRKTFIHLGRRMIARTNGMRAIVVRMDTGVTAFLEVLPLPQGVYQQDSPTAAIVVNPDQYEMWSRYARALAQIGVMRAVFLASQQGLAYRWAAAQAHAGLSELPR